MLAGKFGEKEVDLISVFEGVGRVARGEWTEKLLKDLEDCACPGCGSCAGMFTANSMNCLSEALGMALPGNGTIPAVDSARIRLAKTAGMKIMELWKKNIRPRDIATLVRLSETPWPWIWPSAARPIPFCISRPSPTRPR